MGIFNFLGKKGKEQNPKNDEYVRKERDVSSFCPQVDLGENEELSVADLENVVSMVNEVEEEGKREYGGNNTGR